MRTKQPFVGFEPLAAHVQSSIEFYGLPRQRHGTESDGIRLSEHVA